MYDICIFFKTCKWFLVYQFYEKPFAINLTIVFYMFIYPVALLGPSKHELLLAIHVYVFVLASEDDGCVCGAGCCICVMKICVIVLACGYGS